ncbi:MAG: TIGR04086 family membrane protein [Lachnospiraceae bacterium]
MMKKVKNTNKKMESIAKVLFASGIATAVLLLIFALIAWSFDLSGGAISAGISAVYVIACFIGGFLAGKIAGTRKFLWGLLIGAFYFVIVFGCSVIGNPTGGSELSDLWNLLLCLGGGMLGGMVS